MGLDIYLYKVNKNKGNKETDDYMFLDPTDEFDTDLISKFKNMMGTDVLFSDTDEYFNFKALGITDDTHQFAMSDGKTLKVHEIKHELFNILDSVYTEEYKLSDSDIALLNKYNFDKIQTLSTNNILTDEEKIQIYSFIDNIIAVNIDLENCPIYIQNGYTVYYTEEGYQRKGLKPGFADDENIESYIFTKDKLMYIYDTYVKDEYKEHFKTRILDQFIEGTHFVHFSY